MGDVFVGFVVFFIFLLVVILLCFFVSSQEGVECAIPHTAIYAGQELWHFISCLFVNVQAEMTCIFQMLYL